MTTHIGPPAVGGKVKVVHGMRGNRPLWRWREVTRLIVAKPPAGGKSTDAPQHLIEYITRTGSRRALARPLVGPTWINCEYHAQVIARAAKDAAAAHEAADMGLRVPGDYVELPTPPAVTALLDGISDP